MKFVLLAWAVAFSCCIQAPLCRRLTPKRERRKIPAQSLEARAKKEERAEKENGGEAPQTKKRKRKVAEEAPSKKRAEGEQEDKSPQKKEKKVAKKPAEGEEIPKDADAELAAAQEALAEAGMEWEAAKEAVSAASDVSLWWDVDVVKADAERGAEKALKAARKAQDKMDIAIRKVRLGMYKVQKAKKAKKDLVYAVEAAVPDHVRQSDIEAFLEPILHQELLTEFESMLTSQAEYYEDKFGQVSTRTHEMFSRLGSQGP